MRIGIITGEYPPMQGGVGAFTHELAKAFVAQGNSVSVLTDGSVSSSTANGITVDGSVRSWNRAVLGQIINWTQSQRLDVVNIQYEAAAFKMSQLIHFLPRFVSVPTITTFHDLLVPYLFPKAGPLRYQAVLTLARTSDGVIVTNRQDEEKIKASRGIPPLRNIPIGSNISNKLPPNYDRAGWRVMFNLPNDSLLVGYFGFMNTSKGVDTLLKGAATAIANGLNVHLLMIGGRTGSSDPTNIQHADTMDTLVEQLGLQARIHWTGFVNDQAVSSHLTACDLVALPYRDGVSLRRGSFMAALAHGCAIITTQPEVELPEVLDRCHALLIPPDSPDALARSIAELARDSKLCAVLQRNAVELSHNFGWDRIAAQTVDFFSELVSKFKGASIG